MSQSNCGTEDDLPVRQARGRGRIPRTSGLPSREVTFTQFSVSEILTEEQIQREKLREAQEIEVGIAEIKEATSEFAALLAHQQNGLDNMTGNIAAASCEVSVGRNELQAARRSQRCGKRMLCFVLVVSAFVAVALAVTVFSVLKK